MPIWRSIFDIVVICVWLWCVFWLVREVATDVLTYEIERVESLVKEHVRLHHSWQFWICHLDLLPSFLVSLLVPNTHVRELLTQPSSSWVNASLVTILQHLVDLHRHFGDLGDLEGWVTVRVLAFMGVPLFLLVLGCIFLVRFTLGHVAPQTSLQEDRLPECHKKGNVPSSTPCEACDIERCYREVFEHFILQLSETLGAMLGNRNRARGFRGRPVSWPIFQPFVRRKIRPTNTGVRAKVPRPVSPERPSIIDQMGTQSFSVFSSNPSTTTPVPAPERPSSTSSSTTPSTTPSSSTTSSPTAETPSTTCSTSCSSCSSTSSVEENYGHMFYECYDENTMCHDMQRDTGPLTYTEWFLSPGAYDELDVEEDEDEDEDDDW